MESKVQFCFVVPKCLQFTCNLPYTPAYDISAPERWFAVLLLKPNRQQNNSKTPSYLAYILPPNARDSSSAAAKSAKKDSKDNAKSGTGNANKTQSDGISSVRAPVPMITPSYADTDRGAAVRALDHVLRMQKDSYHLTQLPPSIFMEPNSAADVLRGCASAHMIHMYLALLSCPEEEEHLAIAEEIGQWVSLESIDNHLMSTWGPPAAATWSKVMHQMSHMAQVAFSTGLGVVPGWAGHKPAAVGTSKQEADAAPTACTADHHGYDHAECNGDHHDDHDGHDHANGHVDDDGRWHRHAHLHGSAHGAKSYGAQQVSKQQNAQQGSHTEQTTAQVSTSAVGGPGNPLPVTLLSGFLGAGKQRVCCPRI